MAIFKPDESVHYSRLAGINWHHRTADGNPTIDQIQSAALYSIRDELRKLNTLLHCSNFLGIPGTLRGIRKNTTKAKRKKAVK